MAVSRVSDMLGFFTRRSDVVQLADLDQEVIDAFETDPPQNSVWVGMIAPFATVNNPPGWFFCDGDDTISRTTYPDLFNRLSQTVSGSVTQASLVMSVTSAAGLGAGMGVSGTGIPTGTTLTAANSVNNTVTLSQAATTTNSGSYTFLNWGVGSSDSTFKLPDLRGEFLRGIDANSFNDPDASTRIGGDRVGSSQASEIGSHTHSGVTPQGGNWFSRYSSGGNWPGERTGNNRSASTDATGGNESRPRNIAIRYCIKH